MIRIRRLPFALLALLTLAAPTALAQLPSPPYITTFAGSHPVGGFAGDNGPSVLARLNAPRGGAFDQAGNFYFADANNHRIRRIDRTGIITTVVGTGVAGFAGDGGPASAALLNRPYDVAFNWAGEMFIADADNNRVRMVDANGTITTYAGGGAYSLHMGDGGPALGAYLGKVADLEIGPDEDLYLSSANARLRKIDAFGTITTPYPSGVGVNGFGFSPNGNLYMAKLRTVERVDTSTGVLTVIAGQPSAGGFSGDGGMAYDAKLDRPSDVSFDPNGMLYISDNSNHRIRSVAGDGVIRTVAGRSPGGYNGDNRDATTAGLAYPTTVLFPPAVTGYSGGYLIMDTSSLRIRRVSALPYYSTPYEPVPPPPGP